MGTGSEKRHGVLRPGGTAVCPHQHRHEHGSSCAVTAEVAPGVFQLHCPSADWNIAVAHDHRYIYVHIYMVENCILCCKVLP